MIAKSSMNLRDLKARFGRQASDKIVGEIARLNPHVNLEKRIESGTVLVLPDSASGRSSDSLSVEGQSFDELRKHVVSALDATASRVHSRHEALREEAKEIAAVLRSAAVKRALEGDPELKEHVRAATEIFKEDAARAKATETSLKKLKARAEKELYALGKLLQ
jgi:hypothetical protein